MEPMQKAAVIYARVSSIGERQSTARQVADLTEYAEYADLDVIKIFEEHGSGVKSDRPILAECLDFCVAKHVDVLLVSEMSRLGRKVDDLIANINRLRDARIDVYMQREAFHTLTPAGEPHPFLSIFVAVLGTAAAMEREAIMSRLNSGLRRYKEAGGQLGRRPGTVESDTDIVGKYPKVVREIRKGTSIRRTAKLCDVSTGTVAKVKRAIKASGLN